MSARNPGGAAFPSVRRGEYDDVHPGLSLRDYFAAAAMQGMLANPQQDYAPLTQRAQEAVVADAYGIADAMLLARES